MKSLALLTFSALLSASVSEAKTIKCNLYSRIGDELPLRQEVSFNGDERPPNLKLPDLECSITTFVLSGGETVLSVTLKKGELQSSATASALTNRYLSADASLYVKDAEGQKVINSCTCNLDY